MLIKNKKLVHLLHPIPLILKVMIKKLVNIHDCLTLKSCKISHFGSKKYKRPSIDPGNVKKRTNITNKIIYGSTAVI